MKTIIKNVEQLAENMYTIAKSFAEVYKQECTSKETILESLNFYEWYCRKNELPAFYCRISTTDGFVMMDEDEIFESGLICKVFLIGREIRVIYKTR